MRNTLAYGIKEECKKKKTRQYLPYYLVTESLFNYLP